MKHSELVRDGQVAFKDPAPMPAGDFERRGLDGSWVYRVGQLARNVSFRLNGDALEMRGEIGDFTGGVSTSAAGVIVLVRRELDGPGPPVTTWLNLVADGPGAMAGYLQALSGEEDDPIAVRIEKR